MKTGTRPFRRFLPGLVIVAILAMSAVDGLPAAGIVTLGASGWRDQPPELSVSGGGTLFLSLLVPSSLKPEDLVINRWQMANEVMIPLGEGMPFRDAMMAASADAQGVTTLCMAFPEVKKKTCMMVQFRTVKDPPVDAGRAQVWVYPPINWAPLSAKFKTERPSLLVFGRDDRLRDFLKAHDLLFSEGGETISGEIGADTLAMGVLPEKIWRESKPRLGTDGGRIIVFVTGSSGLPGVYTTMTGAGAITQVTLPIIDHLGPDPRTQDFFIRLIEQHLNRAPAALP